MLPRIPLQLNRVVNFILMGLLLMGLVTTAPIPTLLPRRLHTTQPCLPPICWQVPLASTASGLALAQGNHSLVTTAASDTRHVDTNLDSLFFEGAANMVETISNDSALWLCPNTETIASLEESPELWMAAPSEMVDFTASTTKINFLQINFLKFL